MSCQLRVAKRFRAQRAVQRELAKAQRLEDDFDAANSVEAELRINTDIAYQRASVARRLRRLERL